jgi:hypothetical protein
MAGMPASLRRSVSRVLLALCLLLCPSFLFLYFGANDTPADAGSIFEALAYSAFLVFPFIGALITKHRPQNTEGLVFSVAGLAWLLEGTAFQYATYGLINEPGSVPYPEFAAWLSNWLWVPEIAPLTTFALLLFPTGSLPGPRWALVAWLAGAGIFAAGLGAAFSSGDLEGFDPEVAQNPFALKAIGPLLTGATFVGVLAIAAAAVASAASVVVRLRRSEGIERQQMKWFAYAAGIAAVAVLSTIVGYIISTDTGQKAAYALLALFGLPIAAGIAILRYRLYDIDLIINRTIVYGTLTAILAGVYSASLVLFKFLFESVSGSGSQATTVLTTLVLAALFTPIRSRLQTLVDRYVGRAPEPIKDLTRFTDELRLVLRALNPEATLRELAGHAMRVTNASGVRIYLQRDGHEEEVLSQGVFLEQPCMRLPVEAAGVELGWIELATSASPESVDRLSTQRIEEAATVVAEALTFSLVPQSRPAARLTQAPYL